ncbi:putative non-specific serine/threonine protein kinase [Helianthus annuus]|nr:putative non-specific serine/threonine protein kinase [Helianthus annuus]
MMASWIICCCFALFLIFNPYSTTAQLRPDNYPTANLSTTWNNTNPSFSDSGTRIRFILLRGSLGPTFGCGFYCNGRCTSYLFAVFIVVIERDLISGYFYVTLPQVVWSANRDSPVSRGATLNFTATGELVLQDVDGSTVWSTNTAGKSVVGMKLTDTGNLVLFNVNGSVVWQSFDYPTDCLLPGQRLFQGQQLIPSVSDTKWTAQKGLFSLQVTDEGLVAYVGSNPPQVYYKTGLSIRGYAIKKRKYIRFLNGSLSFFFSSADQSPYDYIQIPFASSAQYMKFMPDGHLKVFEWQDDEYTLGGWSEVADLITNEKYGNCTYPLACGRNAICSNYQQCSCPVSNPFTIDYFRAVNDRLPNQGCSAVTPLTCNAIQDHVFISLQDVTYYGNSTTGNYNSTTYMENVSMERCKQACLNNCSCKAAFFSSGACFLPSEIFTMKTVDAYLNVTAFIKVQRSQKPKKSHPIAVIITSIIGSSLILLVVVGFITFLNRKLRSDAQMEEEYIDAVPGLPTRFTYEELKTATENFCKKLGQGGFGSVFEVKFYAINFPVSAINFTQKN